MNSLIDWWLHSKEFTEAELEYLNYFCYTNKVEYDGEGWNKLVENLKGYIPLGHTLNSHNLYLHESASNFITYLFDKYVTDDTLLITSIVEHDIVEQNIARLNRGGVDHVRMHYYNGMKSCNLSQIIQATQNKQYKKAFVYIIGTQITTGENTPQEFYIKLRKYLERMGIEVVMVIDDVHGMYLHPRDYGTFDYVICTAHALIRRWDMGIMWSKTKEDYGHHWGNCLKGYTDRLNMILSRVNKLATFSSMVYDALFNDFNIPNVEYVTDSVSHIFSLKVSVPPRFIYTQDEVKKLSELEVQLGTQDYNKENIFYIRMRASQYITFPDLLYPAVASVKDILARVKAIEKE